MNIPMAPVVTSSHAGTVSAPVARRETAGLDKDRLRQLLVRSDLLLEELERQNLADISVAERTTMERLDHLLDALPARRRPSPPDEPTPSAALDVVFAAQEVLFRLLGTV
jgi:hypothetical protein